MAAAVMHSLESRTLLATVPAGFAESLVASGLVSPTAMAFAPDGRLFIAEKSGTIRIYHDEHLHGTPFATLAVNALGERGLGGITFDPDFENNGYVYVYYTASSPTVHNRLSRLTADDDLMVPGSELVLLDLPGPDGSASIHNGGSLQFADDGTLFVAVGEHGASSSAPSMTSLFGKILRLNSDGTIPLDNPFYET